MSIATSSNLIKTTPYFSAFLVTLVTILGLAGCGGGGSSSDPDPTVSLAEASIAEGNSGSTDLIFTLTASTASDTDITVTYATTADTATANTDYTETSGSIVIPAGSTSATITVPVIGEEVYEGDETLTLTLTAATGATLGSVTATGTIQNDDNEPSVSIATARVDEGDSDSTDLDFTLTATNASDTDIAVTYETTADTATTAGSAIAGTDYTETSGSVVIPAGSTSATITVPVIGDEVYEGDETLTLTLTAATGATLGTETATGTIRNDDNAPTVSIDGDSVVEGNSGTTDLVFAVSASNASDSLITLTYATSDGSGSGSASAGNDYEAPPLLASVDIQPGNTSATINVPVIGDSDIEVDETFTLTLSAATGATLGTTSATGTILNDDHANPSAYYTGSATVRDPGDITKDIVLSDLKVMVSGNRMIMMSKIGGGILYDAQITSIAGNDYSADVTIYTGLGLNPYAPESDTIPAPEFSTITGSILEGSSIQGAIAGTGSATGVFSANFDNMSGTAADSANIAKTWEGDLSGRSDANIKLTLDSSGLLTVAFLDIPRFGIFASCRLSGSITPINLESLYLVDLDLVNCGQGPTSGKYTGFAIPVSQSYDALTFTFSNGNLAGFAELTVAP